MESARFGIVSYRESPGMKCTPILKKIVWGKKGNYGYVPDKDSDVKSGKVMEPNH